eukprot:7830316-Pyramimonas_sp.AAC.1
MLTSNRYHFNTTTNPTGIIGGVWPDSVQDGKSVSPPKTDGEKTALVDALQDAKTEVYKVGLGLLGAECPPTKRLKSDRAKRATHATRAAFSACVDPTGAVNARRGGCDRRVPEVAPRQ